MFMSYLVVLADVAPTLADMVPFDCHYCCVNIYGWQVLSHIVMNHVGRCYSKVADGIATIAKG